jgi:hypothetical protein
MKNALIHNDMTKRGVEIIQSRYLAISGKGSSSTRFRYINPDHRTTKKCMTKKSFGILFHWSARRKKENALKNIMIT